MTGRRKAKKATKTPEQKLTDLTPAPEHTSAKEREVWSIQFHKDDAISPKRRRETQEEPTSSSPVPERTPMRTRKSRRKLFQSEASALSLQKPPEKRRKMPKADTTPPTERRPTSGSTAPPQPSPHATQRCGPARHAAPPTDRPDGRQRQPRTTATAVPDDTKSFTGKKS